MKKEKKEIYDLIIVGAGPAGLGASIYSSRYKLKHIVLGEEVGGQVVEASKIENYAGFESISGKDLMDKFRKQTEDLGTKIIQSSVSKIEKKDDKFEILSKDGKEYFAKALILALGMKPRRMNIVGEKEFIGKGVSYCATCDAMFFRNKNVVVVGGGDAAAMAAQHLSEFADKVYVLHRQKTTWNPAREDALKSNNKIELVCCADIKEIKGEQTVNEIIYSKDEKNSSLEVEGVFIEIGSVPGIELIKKLNIKTDDKDYIVVDQTQATNVSGVWAAGDVTTGSNKFRQIITAVAEGAVASGSAYKELKLK